MHIYYIDGRFVDENQACISVNDLIVLRGFGVFDALITYNRRPFHLQFHVNRLFNSARNIGLAIRESRDEICDIVRETINRNGHLQEANLRIVYSGGVSSDGVTPQNNGILMVMISPRPPRSDSWYREGAKIITLETERFIPAAKSTNYLKAIIARQQAREAGAIEAIYVDREQQVLEGTISNIFGFQGDKLITPGADILPGITRQVVLDLVKDRFNIEIRTFQTAELYAMDEVFITGSSKEIVPIVQIDDAKIADGRPGPISRQVMQLFKDYTTAYGRGEI